jgi:hypothetical protein
MPKTTRHAHGQPELRLDGKRSAVTVTLGAWSSKPPLDRFNVAPAPNRNIHVVQPNERSQEFAKS